MAKANGILKIEGTVEDLTFYKKDGKHFVRRKGGVSRERIETDPSYVRTRENNSEFRHSMASGKLLRTAMGSLVFKAKDSQLSSRMMQIMTQVKNLDTTSVRGQRKVPVGILTENGKNLFAGFDFNAKAPLEGILFVPFDLDTATGVISISALVPAEQLQFPQGATHYSLQSAVLNLDFQTELSDITFSPIFNGPIDLTVVSPTLTPVAMPLGTGVTFYLLSISFYQSVNGLQYSLKNEEYNVLNIVAVV